jgi:hypothetical protein
MLHHSPLSLKYLETASDRSLESYEMSRLNHASNLRKEIGELIDQWMDESAAALLARWLLEHRRQLRRVRSTRAKSLDVDQNSERSDQLIPAHRQLT